MDNNSIDRITLLEEKLKKAEITISNLTNNINGLTKSIIILKNNDVIARTSVSKLQNFVFGLFKKLLSQLGKTPIEKTSVIEWSEHKTVMCNCPEHLGDFNVNTKYCGTNPTCPDCIKLNKIKHKIPEPETVIVIEPLLQIKTAWDDEC